MSVVRFVNDNVTPLAGLRGSLLQGIKDSMHRLSSAPAPIPLTPTALSTRTRATSLFSHEGSGKLSLDDDSVVEELRKHIIEFLFAECMDGISADVQLFLRKPHSIAWCSPSVFWSDFDYAVPLISKIINEEEGPDSFGRSWVIDTFHAQMDAMVGEKGKIWFDSCWMSRQFSSDFLLEERASPAYSNIRNGYKYRSQVVEGTEHNYLMDPAFGASETWLQRVRDAFPVPIEVCQLISNHLAKNYSC
jgi:hypothetical protein